MKRRIIIEIDSEIAGFGRPALRQEGGLNLDFSSLSASDLSKPEITIEYHTSEDPADLALLVEEIVTRMINDRTS